MFKINVVNIFLCKFKFYSICVFSLEMLTKNEILIKNGKNMCLVFLNKKFISNKSCALFSRKTVVLCQTIN